MERRPVEGGEVRDGKVVVRVRGLFGGSGVSNITLREEDVRRSAPFARSPEAAAVVISKQRWAYMGNIVGRDKRAERIARKEARAMGKDTLKLTLDFAEGEPVDVVKALKTLERLHADPKTNGWVTDTKHTKKKQWELVVSNERFGPGVRAEKSVFQRRRELVEAIVSAAKEEDLELAIEDMTWSDK